MSEEVSHGKKKPRGKPVEFDRASLKNWVTGFAKRKQERRQAGAIQLAKKQRQERNAQRKERRDAMKIKDRLTGAFGEKHLDDSDDELGDAAQNPEEFEREQQEERKEAKSDRHEDERAVVTVVTREGDSDDDMSDDLFDDSDLDLPDVPASAAANASTTPYNPSKSHQASALQKAKLTLKSKDKAKKKGIKGGHAFKRAKITSKKKNIKFGKKKGANRDR